METIISRDGTPIAFERRGAGRALVLVHGTVADHTHWRGLLPELARGFTVCALDRRGRGRSGDAPPYDLRRELEDVAAVAEAAGGAVDLLGHSFGAICALEAARQVKGLRRLVLYEPPILLDDAVRAQALEAAAVMEERIRKGRREEALLLFLSEHARMTMPEIERMCSRPGWGARLAMAHTVPRELAGVGSWRLEPDRFASLRVPTLLLLGGDSPPFYREAVLALQSALPEATLAVLPGQRHAAVSAAPALFLREVVRFLG